MQIFKSSKISLGSASVSEQLKTIRNKLGLSLEQVAEQTKISQRYIEALEEGDYHKVPDGIYTLNFLREYAQYLGLDHKKIISGFQTEKRVFRSDEKNNLFSRQVVTSNKMVIVPSLIKNILWGLLLFGCLIYIIVLLNNVFKAPVLKVLTPIDNLTTMEPNVLVSGYSEPETEVRVNEKPVIVSEEGEFSLIIELQPGVNTIAIVAKKGSKQPSKVVKEVLLKTSQ